MAGAEQLQEQVFNMIHHGVPVNSLRNGLRLLMLYQAAGGGLCMRPTTWRKMMTVLHPDKVSIANNVSLAEVAQAE